MVQQREARLVNEWLAMNYPNSLQWRRVRLGPLPTNEMARMYKVTQRWVDAIFITGEVVNLLEAKLRPDLAAIAQLQAYDRLFPDTPEFSQFRNNRRELHFLCPRNDSVMEKSCAENNIQYHAYAPAWLMEPRV